MDEFKKKHSKSFHVPHLRAQYLTDHEYPIGENEHQYLRLLATDVTIVSEKLTYEEEQILKSITAIEGYSRNEDHKRRKKEAMMRNEDVHPWKHQIHKKIKK